MTLSEEIKQKIIEEYKEWEEHQYAGKSKSERQEMGQFFTPPELTIQMIEKFEDMEGTIIDPTCGCGGLLVGCILAGADPKKIYGIEYDENILALCRERLDKFGVPKDNIHLGNALNDDCYDFEDGYEYNKETDTVTFKGKKKKAKFVFGNVKKGLKK